MSPPKDTDGDLGRTWIDPSDIIAEAERLTKVGLAREIHVMNQRIARRREQAPLGRFVPIQGPAWAERVVDIGDELLAIHKDSGDALPLDPHDDLSAEDHAVLVLQRLILAGATQAELERLVRAFGLPSYAKTRLLYQLREGAS